MSEANAGRGGRTESTVSKEELEALKREVEELRARIGADRATSKEAGKDWQVTTGYSLNDSIWKGTVLNDQDVKNRYGPDATVETKQGRQTIGGLAQVWYYGDDLSRRLIEKGQVRRNGDGTVTVLLDEKVSGDSWDPVIRKMPEAEYEALRRKVQQDRYTAGLNYYIRGENAKASSPAFDTRRDELTSETILKTIIERGKNGRLATPHEAALCTVCRQPLHLHASDNFVCRPPDWTVAPANAPVGIENTPAHMDELTKPNVLLGSDLQRQLQTAQRELAQARRDKQRVEQDLSEQSERIEQAINRGIPPEIFRGGETQQRRPSAGTGMPGPARPEVTVGTAGDPELKRQLDSVRNELATVVREKQEIEQTLSEQTQHITAAIQKGVPMELFYSQDPEATQKPLPDARVLAIRPELDLVMLSVGAKDGAKPGYRLTIARGDRFVAKAEIQKVYPEMSSARIFLKQSDVQVGDAVVSRVPGTGEEVQKEVPQNRLLDAAEANRILKDYVVNPPGWASIHPGAGDSDRAQADEPWKRDVRRKLSRRVSFEFRDTPLQEALTFIQTLAKVSIIVDPPAVTTGTAQLKITLRVTDMDLETALKWVLRLAELDYDLRNQAIFISTRERLNANPQNPQHSASVPGVPQKDPKDPPPPPAGTDGTKADEKKDAAEATTKARKLLQEALAALPRTDETARQRLRLFAELASLSTGADVYRVLNDGIENLSGEGPFAEALAAVFLQAIGKEKDATALESALAFTSDPALRANLAVRGGELTTDVEHRLALFARAYRESPSFLRTYVWQLVKAEKNKEAIALLEEALRNGSAEAWIVPQLNELYGRMHDDAGLLRVLTQAVAQRPREAQGRLQLARALDKMGRGPEALRELKLAREFRPEDLPTHREYLALAEKLQDRAAIEDALWGLLDHDWPGDRSVWDDAQKRWKKLVDEYRDAGQDAKAKELKEKLARLKALDLVVRLTWDTDGTDVDLHVTEPSGHQTFYSAMQSRSGNLDRDVRTGYGPETYTARRAAKGTYRIAVNYFSGGKKTKATVTVIRHKDCAEEVTQKFEVQLENRSETAKVLEFEWE